MSAEERVKAAYPNARITTAEFGLKLKYRVENRLKKSGNEPLSGWRDTQQDAWADAEKKMGDDK